ncbi:DNA ligase 1-like [Anneissia japonica]|uniref:DNA ligase 1-like n=1 Tax=Anneissia japonica TaxID=1529436 RepID=UPI001425AD22|nr:DNA ligase 1-like [Anneissia japonica]
MVVHPEPEFERKSKRMSQKLSKEKLLPKRSGLARISSALLAPLPNRIGIGNADKMLKTEKDILKELIEQGIIKPRSLDVGLTLPKLRKIKETMINVKKDKKKDKNKNKKKDKEDKKEKKRKAKKAADERESWLRLQDSACSFEQMKEKQRLARELRAQQRRKRREELLEHMDEIDKEFVDDDGVDEVLFSLPGQVF